MYLRVGPYLLMVVVLTIVLSFFGPVFADSEEGEGILKDKKEILSHYCKILKSTEIEEIGQYSQRLLLTAKTIFLESLEYDGVKDSWAMKVRDMMRYFDDVPPENLIGDIEKIRAMKDEGKPSLAESVCRWGEFLAQGENDKAHRYARWEVERGLNEAIKVVSTDYFRGLFAQLRELAGEKVEEKLIEKPLTVSVCKDDCQYSEVGKGIDAVRDGGEVKIGAGVYEENLVINKNVTLVGEGREEVKIEGRELGYPVLLIGAEIKEVGLNAVLIETTNIEVNLQSLSIVSALEKDGGKCLDESSVVCPYGISATGKSIVGLRNVLVTKNRSGIKLKQKVEATIAGSLIEKSQYYGLEIRDRSKAKLTDSEISEGNAGIFMVDDSEVELNDCNLKEQIYGLWLFDRAKATVKNSVFSGVRHGVDLYDFVELTLIGNRFIDVEKRISGFYSKAKIEDFESETTSNVEEKKGNEVAEDELLEISDWKWDRRGQWIKVVGRAKNVAEQNLFLAEVKAQCYDGQGVLIAKNSVVVMNLRAGSSWDFGIDIFVGDVAVDKVELMQGKSTMVL